MLYIKIPADFRSGENTKRLRLGGGQAYDHSNV